MKDVPRSSPATDVADPFRNVDLRFAAVIVPDKSMSMQLPKLAALNHGLQALIDGLPADVTPRKRQDTAIVPFGPVRPLLPQSLSTRPDAGKSRSARRRPRI